MSNNIDLKKLFTRPNKCDETIVESKIEEIKPKNEFFVVDIINNKNCYKGLIIKKSEIFPKPSIESLIIIKKIYYRLDEVFQPRLFINAQISKKVPKDSANEKENSLLKELNFTENKIRETLQSFLDIQKKLISNLFIVHSVNETHYLLKFFKKKETFILSKEYEFLNYSLKIKDIIYINDYYLEGEEIKLTEISLIEKLSEEKLFILLQEKEEIGNNYLWGKIIEKDQNNKIIRIMDHNKRVLTIKKYNNDIKLGQYFIFSNFSIENNIITLKEDQDDSFYYYSSEELFFSNKIILNLYSVIQFLFIDFIGNNNYYKKISIDTNIHREIKTNEIEIIYNHSENTNNKLIPLEIGLIKNEFNKSSFFVKVLQGLLNKINVFVNYDGEPSYCFEYLYIYFNEPQNNLEKTKTIKCGEKNYIITAFDNFNSNNRIRFNIVNIPMQKDCEEYSTNSGNSLKRNLSNSVLVCESFYNDKKSDIYGIFDIKEIVMNRSLGLTFKNLDYNSYYYIVGGIYDQLKNDKIEDKKALELLNEYETSLKSMDSSLFLYCLTFTTEISSSELKSRLGILICYYLKMTMEKKDFRRLIIFRDIQHVIQKMELIKEQLTNSQILKIFSYLLRAKIEYKIETEILLLSKEKKDSAYLLAQKFLLEEINNINEFSKLFQGYLQMDSYVLYNYKIGALSYSLSIEPIFIIKHHLKSKYEGFLILEEISNDILGWTEPRENITIINEKYLFEKTIFKDPSHIQDEVNLKNCAFGISMVLRHENNSHKKKNVNNKRIASPLYYCEDGKAINITNTNSKIKKGEDGIVIESLITKDYTMIISLAKDFIYGELLNYRLFVQKDFSELMNKANDIKQKQLNSNSDPVYNLNDKQIEMNNIIEKRNIHNYNNQNDEGQLSRLAKEAIKAGIFKLGDVFYTLEDIKEMVMYAKNNKSIDQLYPIFIEIDKELSKSENNNNCK